MRKLWSAANIAVYGGDRPSAFVGGTLRTIAS